MGHLGDITKMSGYTIPPVDVITFGSPCQDLSIAGKRAGMAGERSGLFSEAVRIIREMRYATFGAYPKYAIWENVPGAFSSNKGEDFHAVLQSLCRVIDPAAAVQYFCLLSRYKYLYRCGMKDDATQDISKANWYCDKFRALDGDDELLNIVPDNIKEAMRYES